MTSKPSESQGLDSPQLSPLASIPPTGTGELAPRKRGGITRDLNPNPPKKPSQVSKGQGVDNSSGHRKAKAKSHHCEGALKRSAVPPPKPQSPPEELSTDTDGDHSPPASPLQPEDAVIAPDGYDSGSERSVTPDIDVGSPSMSTVPCYPADMADIIAAAIERGIAAGLQHRGSLPSTSRAVPHSIKEKTCQKVSNDALSQVSVAEVEEQVSRDSELSDDEDLSPAPSSLVGLFKPALFRSILFKAKKVSGIPASKPPATKEQEKDDTTDPLFARPPVEKEVVPSPKLFLEVVQNQWTSPGSGPLPSALDKQLYNVSPELTKLLEVPSIDPPIVALSAPNAATAASEDALRPEDKRFEQTLIKGHQASAWAVRASSSASFFNRAALRWLKQLQERLPPSDTRTHKDLNKLQVAMEYSADASLDAARFASRAIASSVSTRRLLWLKQWQAEPRAKWRLASAPFSAERLFGPPLEPMLVENKDKRKVLPSATRKTDNKPSSSFFRRQPFRSGDGGFNYPRQQRQPPPRQGSAPYDRSGKSNQRFPYRKPYRGNSNRPFRKQK